MVRRDANVRGTRLEHLQNRAQHTNDAAIRRVFALGEAAKTVKVSEQLVRPVEQVHDHMAVYDPPEPDCDGKFSPPSTPPKMCRAFVRASFLVLVTVTTLRAQITTAEYAGRRDSLAARIGDGIVIAFGGRTPVTDYGTFFQLPAFHYLTGYDEPDAAFVLVARGGRATSSLFVTPADPRRAFYYGFRPDSAAIARSLLLPSRPFSALGTVVDSLASTGLPVYTLSDFEDADFARVDTLTRGQQFVRAVATHHPELVVKDGHELLD